MTRVAAAPAVPRQRWWRRLKADFDHINDLPPRVQALVDGEMQRADILAGWIGLAVAAFLGGLYLLSPKALDGISSFRPVPVSVGLFLTLSVFRLRKAYEGPLTRLAQTLFSLADVTLLFVLIWSYHLQYEQPAAFYLKAPTFLFVFLLIAIRTLRFEPPAIVATGLMAAIGWGLMTVYAVHSTPEPSVTKDFTAYLTGNVVLIGAEVEKIVAILLVTFVLTLAIVLGRRSLVLAVRGATARDDLSRFFAPEVAARITAEGEDLTPGFGEMRNGAVLVCDIRGFTVIAARREPSDVVGILIEYQRSMGPIITRHGGSIDKFLGDGILATFGCTRASSGPAAEAMRALDELRREAVRFSKDMEERFGEPVAIGFALAGGPVLCGTIGDEARFEFTVIGEAVNFATRLEKANKEFGTDALVEADTLQAARDQGYAESVGDAREYEIAMTDRTVRRVIGWQGGA